MNKCCNNCVMELNDVNFDKFISNDKLVLVDFWAPWCGPCKNLMPIIDELASEANGEYVIGKLDVDSNQNIPVRYGVKSLPTLIFFKNGVEVERIIGAVPKDAIKSILKPGKCSCGGSCGCDCNCRCKSNQC